MSTRNYSRPEEYLRDADTAMYQAKDAGGDNMSLFNTGMYLNVRLRLELEMELRQAVERQTLEVFYQPVVRIEYRTDF